MVSVKLVEKFVDVVAATAKRKVVEVRDDARTLADDIRAVSLAIRDDLIEVQRSQSRKAPNFDALWVHLISARVKLSAFQVKNGLIGWEGMPQHEGWRVLSMLENGIRDLGTSLDLAEENPSLLNQADTEANRLALLCEDMRGATSLLKGTMRRRGRRG